MGSIKPNHAHTVALDRRRFLSRCAGAFASGAFGMHLIARAAAPASVRPRVAAIITEFTYRSHAHVILENFLKPYLFNGEWTEPGCDVVSMYVDQFPNDRDMARDASRDFNIPIFESIADALRVGTDKLAVDAVLSIGEHGDYPENEKGQREYPRKRFFDAITAVFTEDQRAVPVFNDKHLSYRWDWAKEMYDSSREMGFGLMAGSSVPLAQRRPPLEIARGVELTDAVSIHGGNVEGYDFHALEVLASMIEARAGGESGVKQVRFVDGDALWNAADTGHWSPELAQAAMATELGADHPVTRSLTNRGMTPAGDAVPTHAILIEHHDGLRTAAMKVGDANRWNFACRVRGESNPRATNYYVGPWENRNLFKALSRAIQHHFRTGMSPYPVERTLLTTGILSAAMDSRFEGRVWKPTPELAFAYQPRDFAAFREMGASWKIITEDMEQPLGVDPGGR